MALEWSRNIRMDFGTLKGSFYGANTKNLFVNPIQSHFPFFLEVSESNLTMGL